MSTIVNQIERSSVMVKHFIGRPGLTVQIFKASWRFPTDRTPIPMTVGFDQVPLLDGNAYGYNPAAGRPTGGMVEFEVRPDLSVNFVETFAGATTFWVRFKEGNERPWSMYLSGSRDVTTVFSHCIVSMSPKGTTQPYSGSGTQSYSEPSRPTPVPQPAATKRDDGAV
ncbi:hypothetical protein C7G41_12800 [Bradyrhizobium sp. MOS002]|nr:hypothetical protein C7G41_12800 [Bradyrhizobium sp. MOS002]